MPTLYAGGKVLSTAPNRIGYLTPSDPSDDLENLVATYRRDGYLWLREFLDRDEVLAFRARALSHLNEAGILAPGTDPAVGIAAAEPPVRDTINKLLMELVRSAAFESFCVQPRLFRFMDAFLDGVSYLHKRKLLRYTLPHAPGSTPAHYDLVYLRGGTDRIVTAWIPIGDIPCRMGGLVYLEGSHAAGVDMEREFSRANADLSPEERISAYNSNMTEGGWVSKDLPDMAERFDTRWLVADYDAGDVVLHSPYMIHAATTNEDEEGRIRLSCDIRYQNVRDEIDPRWANHWSLDDML